jgi:hypothetical protein
VTRAVVLLAGAVLSVGVGGCGEGETPHEPGPQTLGALLVGQLHGDTARHCVWLGTQNGGVQLQWPSRYHVRFDPVRIEDALGRVLARAGDWLRVGGGFVPEIRPTPGCPGARREVWVAGRIEFFGSRRPPEARG